MLFTNLPKCLADLETQMRVIKVDLYFYYQISYIIANNRSSQGSMSGLFNVAYELSAFFLFSLRFFASPGHAEENFFLPCSVTPKTVDARDL